MFIEIYFLKTTYNSLYLGKTDVFLFDISSKGSLSSGIVSTLMFRSIYIQILQTRHLTSRQIRHNMTKI